MNEVLAILYGCSLTALIAYFGKSRLSQIEFKGLVSVLGIYTLFYLLHLYFDFIPALSDPKTYLAAMNGADLDEFRSGVRNFGLVHKYLGWLYFFKPILFPIFSISCFMFGVLFVLRSFTWTMGQEDILMWVLVLCFPAAMVYIPQLMREGYIVLTWGLFVYSLYLGFERRNFLLIPVAIFLLWFFRDQMLVFAVLAVSVIGLFYLKVKGLYKVGLVIAGFLGLVLASHFEFLPHISVEAISNMRQEAINRPGLVGSTYGDFSWASFLEIIGSVPALVVQYIAAPIPLLGDFNPLQTLLPFFDAVFLIGLIVLVLPYWKKLRRMPWYWICALLYVIILGFFEYHFTGAVRHRMPLTLMMIPPAGLALRYWLNRIMQKDECK